MQQLSISSSESNFVCAIKGATQGQSVNKSIASERQCYGKDERSLTIWLNPKATLSSKEYENSITQLQSIGNSFKLFDDGRECSDFLHDVKDCEVFLIVSDAVGIHFLSRIQGAPYLHSIYILCVKSGVHEHFLKEIRKIRGVFDSILAICSKIKQSIRQRENNLIPFNVIPASSSVNVNELDPAFMYSQLLKKSMLEIQFDHDAKREFANFLRTRCADDTVSLMAINTFEEYYDTQTPIWWYTKEFFIYSTLNTAWRTQDVEIIIKMGFFFRDLCEQIEQVNSKALHDGKQVVYRGQGMTSTEFERLKQNPGGLLAFVSFLSTSTDEQVAYAFADSARVHPDLIGILFQIEIDPSISSVAFASVNEISYYLDAEREILLSVLSVFRIGNMFQIDERLWQVNLMLTNDNDKQLESLTRYMRMDFQDVTGERLLGKLLRRMDKPDEAEQIFTKLLAATSDESLLEIADLYSELGGIKYSQGEGSNALAYFEKALEIKVKTLHPMDPDLAKTYSSIGTAHCSMANYCIALSYHEKALRIREKVLPPMHPDLGVAYTNLGVVYDKMGNYSPALLYFEKGTCIKETNLPPIHPSLAISYSNIGHVYRMLGHYLTSLSFYEKSLKIEQKSLPPSHPSVGGTYNNIGLVYLLLEDYSSALINLEKSLEIHRESLPSTHPTFAMTYNNIGTAYTSMNDYPTALDYLEKALAIQRTSLPPIHPVLAIIYSNYGRVYTLTGEYSTALSYYERTLAIQQKCLPPLHPDLASTFNNMANVLNTLGLYKEALVHAQRAVQITRDTFGCDHPNFRAYEKDLERFCQKL